MSPEARTLASGAGTLAAGFTLLRYHQLATGHATLDRLGIRGRALRWGWQLHCPPEGLMAIAHAESNGDSANFLGDLGNARAGGLSVGPLQMSRAEAIRQGYVPATMTEDEYRAFADPAHEAMTFEWGARFFAKSYHEANGDLWSAFYAYDKSAYADRAMKWLAATYPGKFTAPDDTASTETP